MSEKEIEQHYLKQPRNSNFASMFGKPRQLRPFFHQRHWSPFDEPWWDYPMFPRMSMYDHPLNSGIETSVIPHDTQNVAGFSEVVNNENEFKVRLDVSHFRIDEITVKTVDDRLKIHAKHDERQDDHGFIQREFTRQYLLPKDIDHETVTSSFSPEGILTIRALKKAIEGKNERHIPIIKGDPADL